MESDIKVQSIRTGSGPTGGTVVAPCVILGLGAVGVIVKTVEVPAAVSE